MGSNTLNISSSLQCPHGGMVQIISANARVKADGAFVALATDQFVIAGCPFQIPVGPAMVPSPCLLVQWLVSDLRTTVNGLPTLSQSSAGLCLNAMQIPQGPVSIANTQLKTQTQ